MPICFLGAILLILTQKSSQKFGDVLGIMIDPKELSGTHLQNADEQNMDASSNTSSVKFLEKELFVLSQGKEEKYPVELMDWGMKNR